jgi:hypothetical protein
MTTNLPSGEPGQAPPASSAPATQPTGRLRRSGIPTVIGSRKRRLAIAALLYVACTVVYAAFAGDRLQNHTVNNHFAVQAEVWSKGRWYLTEEDITARARRNELDMHNSCPVFPAVVMYPLVALAGEAVNFRDALFVVTLAGIGPALLFLALEALRRQGRSPRSEREHAAIAALYAFGSVYFFSAVQGTVWFAAHVVAAALTGGYLLACFRCDSLVACATAGILVGCGFHTRAPFLLCVPLFAFEAARRSLTAPLRLEGTPFERVRDAVSKLDHRRLAARYGAFAFPVVGALALNFWINQQRFGNPFEFGHTLLNVVWMERVKRWGLFSTHYLSRNLTCALTLLPSINPATAPAHVGRVQVSGNGMALWLTTPLYFWLLWPKAKQPLHLALALTAAAIALPDLLYQNSGWLQFGYRFSNDFSPYLFTLLAIGGRTTGPAWKLAAAWSIAVNTWGAATFQKRGFEKYYFVQTYSVPVFDGTMGVQSSTFAPD